MWIFLIILVLGTIIGVVIALRDGYRIDGFIAISGLVGGLVGALVGVLASMAVFYSTLGEPELGTNRDLVALNLGSTASGSFFLGSGQIDGETVYYYAYTREDGGIIVDKVNAADVVLYETDSGEPHIEQWVRTSRWVSGFDIFEYRIYIPEDSIVSNYAVDLEDA